MEEPQIIPNSVIGAVAEVLASHYYSHGKLNALFQRSGAPGEPPCGNCVEKCRVWFSRCNDDYDTNPLEVLGRAIQDFMDADPTEVFQAQREGQEKIRKVLAKNGLTYHLNGIIHTSGSGPASKQLVDILRSGDFPALEEDFKRSLAMVETDPPGAITAASAILESLCKTYIEDNGLQMPDKQTLGALWKAIKGRLLPPDLQSPLADDLQRIISGLTSVLDGIAALRTHVGSAHGRGPSAPVVGSIEARLSVNSAHTATMFILETWQDQKRR